MAELNPQAAGGLPGAAEAAANWTGPPAEAEPVQVPPAQDLLRQSAYGDEGADAYNRLQRAGERAPVPAPATPMANLAGVPQGLDIGSAIGASLLGAAKGDPMMGQKLLAGQQKQALAVESGRQKMAKDLRDNYKDFFDLVPKMFDMFPGQPTEAVGTLMRQAAIRGIQVDPAVIALANHMDKDGSLTSAERQKIFDDPSTPVGRLAQLGTNTKVFSDVVKANAELRKAMTDAEVSAEALKALPEKQQREKQKEIDAAEGRRLDLERKRGMPKTTDERVAERTKIAEATAAAREAATTTAATRTMHEAAPTVKFLAKQVSDDLDALNETQGEGALEAHARADAERQKALADVKTDDVDLSTEEGFNTLQARYRSALTIRGVTDPKYMAYLTDTNLLRTMLMRMHMGAKGSEYMMKEFKEDINAAVQSSANMRTTLKRLNDYADFVIKEKGNKPFDFDSAYKGGAGATTVGGERSAADFLNE